MKKNLFDLTPEERLPFTVLTEKDVPLVRRPLIKQSPLKSIKKRARVAKGSLLAVNVNPDRGDIHSPIDGIVRDVTPRYVEIEYDPLPARDAAPAPSGEDAAKPAEDIPDKVEPVSLDGLDSAALAAALKKLGVTTKFFTKPCDVFIINGLSTEPGVRFVPELLASQLDILQAGFNLLRRLNPAKNFILVTPPGCEAKLQGASVYQAPAIYPYTLRMPLVRRILGQDDAENVGFTRLFRLHQMGQVAVSGLPLTRMAITVMGKNYLAPLGTPLETFFDLHGITPEEGDTVILGGLMRGSAMATLHRGIGRPDEGVQFIKKGSMPYLQDNPCFHCGSCVNVCPMRLRPNMLSRYAQYRDYAGCRKQHLDLCIECGMCGYVCPACRPMQQYFRMAKFNLGIPSLQHLAG
jgi:electron transport complex protein RnfC